MIDEINGRTDDTSIRCIPDAVVMFNGGVDSDSLLEMFPQQKDALAIAPPIQHVRENLPPGILFHGTHDQNIPHEKVQNFVQAMTACGNEYELVSFEGMGHGFFNYGNHGNEPYRRTLEEAETFLRQHNFL